MAVNCNFPNATSGSEVKSKKIQGFSSTNGIKKALSKTMELSVLLKTGNTMELTEFQLSTMEGDRSLTVSSVSKIGHQGQHGPNKSRVQATKKLLRIKPESPVSVIFIYLFGVLRCFQHCTGHIMTGSWKGRGNKYLQFFRVLYCKLPTNSKQLPAFPHESMPGIEPRPQRWEARVLPLCVSVIGVMAAFHIKETLQKKKQKVLQLQKNGTSGEVL